MLQESNEDLKARRESLLDEVSHLKRDLELSSSERKQEEGAQSELAKENERLRQTIAEMVRCYLDMIDPFESIFTVDAFSRASLLETAKSSRKL